MLGNVIDNQLKFSKHIKWLVYSEYHKSFEELFQINKNISIHQKHLCSRGSQKHYEPRVYVAFL